MCCDLSSGIHHHLYHRHHVFLFINYVVTINQCDPDPYLCLKSVTSSLCSGPVHKRRYFAALLSVVVLQFACLSALLCLAHLVLLLLPPWLKRPSDQLMKFQLHYTEQTHITIYSLPLLDLHCL
jgi:hypothetical protein